MTFFSFCLENMKIRQFAFEILRPLIECYLDQINIQKATELQKIVFRCIVYLVTILKTLTRTFDF